MRFEPLLYQLSAKVFYTLIRQHKHAVVLFHRRVVAMRFHSYLEQAGVKLCRYNARKM